MVCNDLRVCGHVPVKPSVSGPPGGLVYILHTPASLPLPYHDFALRWPVPLVAPASFAHLPIRGVCVFFGFIFVTIIPFFFFPWSRKASEAKGRKEKKKKKTRLLLPASSPRRNNTNNPKETAASPRFLSAARPGDLSPGVRCSTGHCGSLTLD